MLSRFWKTTNLLTRRWSRQTQLFNNHLQSSLRSLFPIYALQLNAETTISDSPVNVQFFQSSTPLNKPELPMKDSAEHQMDPAPKYSAPWYKGSGKLKDKVAIITGGDSGIGRSVAILYAREGAKVAIVYYQNDKDAEDTKKEVENEGSQCLTIKGDLSEKKFCNDVVKQTVDKWGQLDILVNHAGVQAVNEDFLSISESELYRTFRVNVFSQFFLAQAAIPHMKEGSSIINTSSVNAYKGHPVLIDYSATKGANTAFTYSLSEAVAPKGIRVNSVAPGPIWTPLVLTFSEEKLKSFGKSTTLGRAGQPEEVAPSYVFLASQDASYITGQTIHPNGGKIVGS